MINSLIFLIGFALTAFSRLLYCGGVICYGNKQGIFTHIFLTELIGGLLLLIIYRIYKWYKNIEPSKNIEIHI